MIKAQWLGIKKGCVLLLAVGLLTVLPGCAPEPPSVRLAPITGSENDPTIMFEGFKMVSTKGAQQRWIFRARAAQIYEKINLAKAQDIEMIYLKNGKAQSTLTAKKGLLNTKTNHMEARDRVKMVSSDGVVLTTEKLDWDQSRERIYTNQPVRVERQDSILTGIGLEADSELRHLEILAKVHIKLKSLKGLKPNEQPQN